MASVEVLRCPTCNTPRTFSAEHEQRIRAGRAPLTPCRECRRVWAKPTERDRQFWIEQFGLDECRELAVAIWG